MPPTCMACASTSRVLLSWAPRCCGSSSGTPRLREAAAQVTSSLVAYAAAQVAFYFHGQVVLAFAGYGMPYSLTHARDALIWAVFLIGDVNFLVAAIALVDLLVRRHRLAAFAETPVS